MLSGPADPIADDVRLPASELVTTVVKHTDDGGELRAWVPRPGVPLRPEVEDPDPALPDIPPRSRRWVVGVCASSTRSLTTGASINHRQARSSGPSSIGTNEVGRPGGWTSPTWREPTGRRVRRASCLSKVRRTRAAACRNSDHCPASRVRPPVVGRRWSGRPNRVVGARDAVVVGEDRPERRRPPGVASLRRGVGRPQVADQAPSCIGIVVAPQRAHDASSCPNELVLGHGPGRGAQARNDGNDRGDAGEQLVIQLFGRRINVAPRWCRRPRSGPTRSYRGLVDAAACWESTSRFVCRTTGVWS